MKAGRAAVAVVVALASLRAVADEDDDAKKPKPPLTRVVKIVRAEDEAAFAGVDVEAYGLPGGTVTKRTGDDGTVRFEKVPRQGVTFVARHDGRYCGWHEPGRWWWSMPEEDDDPDGDGVTTMTLALVKGATCEGRVVAFDDGTPVAGAVVEAREDPDGVTDVWYLHAAPIWTATTGADGRLRTEADRPLVDGKESRYPIVRLTARAPGWISEEAQRSRTTNEFRLRRAATLRGVVKDGDGNPAAGVGVHACPSDFAQFCESDDDRRTDETQHPRVLHVVTDANGRYEMPELHPGTKFFVYAERRRKATADEFDDGEPVARSEVVPGVGAAKARESAVCDLTLHALGTLVVAVAPDAGGDADRIRIDLARPAPTLPWDDDEESPGGRTWKHLLPGTYVVRVAANGWSSLAKPVEIPEGQRIELTIRLDRGAAVEGVVVDDTGAPASGVSVTVWSMAPRAPGSERERGEADTDASGAFRVTGLPAGPVEIHVSGAKVVPGGTIAATAPAPGLRLTAVREPRISLRVDAPPGVDLNGELTATIVDLDGKYAGMRDPRFIPWRDLPVELDRVRPGPVDVVVDASGYAPSAIRVDLRPGETTVVGPFSFEEGVTLAGTVTGTAGRAIAGAKITAYESSSHTASTDAHGAFVLPHLAKGMADIAVVADGYPETFVVAPTDAPLAVVLHPGGLVRGTVRAADPKHADRRLCIYDAAAPNGFVPHWHAIADKDRKFTVRLPAGRYRFVPSRYEFEEGGAVFDVTEGGETSVEFELR